MKKITGILLAIIMVAYLLLVPTYAERTGLSDDAPAVEVSATSGDWAYRVNPGEDTIYIYAYTGTETDVQFPSELDGYTVTSIGKENTRARIFLDAKSITSVTVPEGITGIYDFAFSGCSSMTSLSLPDSLLDIGESAFRGCASLTKIELPSELRRIGREAFCGCSMVESITLSDKIIDIGDFAFDTESSVLRELSEIPKSVTSIGNQAFCTAGLSEITVNGDNERYCSDGGVLFDKNQTKLLAYPGKKADAEYSVPETVTTISVSAFEQCENLKKITIPKSVANIEYGNFRLCSNFETVSVNGENEKYTDLDGVLYDRDLTKVVLYPPRNSQTDCKLPDTVTDIGDYAFYYTKNLKSLTIPKTVSHIGSYSLYNCEGLTDIYYGGSQSQWEELVTSSVKLENDALESAKIHYADDVNPDDWTYTVSSGNATITGYSGSETVVKIPAQIGGYTVKSIKGRSSSKSIFANPEQITEIIIPEGITSIDNYAFTRCESLTSVTIPESVTSIGSYAFYRCLALNSVELPNALETIGLRAFYSCNALTEFSIPASVKSIGSPVISGSDLREISVDENNTDYCSVDGVLYNKDKTNLMLYPAAKESAEYRIPDTVKTLDEAAIVSTYNLREMYISASLTEVNGNNNFYQCRALENFYVDESNTVYTDIDGVLYNKAVTKLLSRPAKNPNTEFVIPDTVTAVEQYGLFDLRNLTSLTIPSNVTSISSRSFGYTCNDLKDIYYGGTSENWDRLWSFTMPYTEYFPNAEIHYDVNPKPSASPSPSPSASTSPSPSPSASTTPSPSPSASVTPSPSPTRDPYKWTVLSFTEEYRRVFISVGKNVEKGTPFTIIAAKYNGDELIDVVVDNFKTTEESGIGQSFTLSKDITPNEEGEYVKIMLWENTTSCKPLSDPYIGDIKIAAFPGAEGGGKYAKGARAYSASRREVYHVTNLNDSGEGSFRDAVSQHGGVVVFDIGGTINLKTRVEISGDVTILGQTAPGDGITITGANVSASQYENIIRYLRIRPTFINGLECDAFGGQLKNGIIDHCSTSYSIDECLTFYGNTNVTVQNCISSESLRDAGHEKGNHGYGGIWGGTDSSYHHNLMATHDSRTPRLDRQLQGTDVRNNIIYNWGNTNSAYGGESTTYDGDYVGVDTKVNWVNNYYKAGAATASKLLTRLFDTSSPKEHPSYFYFSGNVLEGNTEITNDNTKGVRISDDRGMVFLDEPVEMTYNIPEETAEETYATLLSHVGASLPRRDETDARVINDVINGTGRIIDNASEVGGVMQYEPTYRTFEIPQEWKEANGMGDVAETDVIADGKWAGYMWIEAYVNEWTEQQSAPTNPTVTVSTDKTAVNGNEPISVSVDTAALSGTEIVRVDIYDNDRIIRSHTGAEAADSIQLGTGTHYISAVAHNNRGESTRSTPNVITVSGENDGIYLNDAILKDDTVTFSITNNSGGIAPAQYFISVYDENGVLTDCDGSVIDIPKSTITIKRTINAPDGTTVKLFLWDKDMLPYIEPCLLKE